MMSDLIAVRNTDTINITLQWACWMQEMPFQKWFSFMIKFPNRSDKKPRASLQRRADVLAEQWVNRPGDSDLIHTLSPPFLHHPEISGPLRASDLLTPPYTGRRVNTGPALVAWWDNDKVLTALLHYNSSFYFRHLAFRLCQNWNRYSEARLTEKEKEHGKECAESE